MGDSGRCRVTNKVYCLRTLLTLLSLKIAMSALEQLMTVVYRRRKSSYNENIFLPSPGSYRDASFEV